MSNDVQKIVTYLALILHNRHDDDLTIRFEEIEKGLPAGHGVEMEQLPNGDLRFTIVDRKKFKAENEQ